ncbi:MAG: F0F1 ATP synthase subunit A [Acidobacteriota bacterium]
MILKLVEEHASEAAEHAVEAVHGAKAAGAASHGGSGVAEILEHHILNSNTIEVPFIGEVHLPHIELFGIDISITKHVVMMWISSLVLIILFAVAFRRKSATPKGLAAMLEMMVQFVRDEIAIKNIGEEGRRYTSYLLTTFFFILACNLLGLIPYGATATANIGVTTALAGMSFIMIQVSGMIKHGPIKHFKNLIPHGINPFLLPIMIPVEIMGMFTKPFALCIRLFANMTAGHIVILCLLSLIFVLKTLIVAPASVAFAIFIYFLELLVAIIQAYIFTMLTSLFIGMSVHPHH